LQYTVREASSFIAATLLRLMHAAAAAAFSIRPPHPRHRCRNQQFKVLVDAAEDPTAQQQLKGGSKGSPPYVRGVAFDASGRYLLAGGEDKTAGLRVWDCATWQLLQAM
jgi:hypothetical protein